MAVSPGMNGMPGRSRGTSGTDVTGGDSEPGRSAARSAGVTAAAYAVLFLLGAAQGMLGSFQYSRLAPAGAILLCAGIGVTCLLAAWGMRTVSGAFLPAVGWALASFVLSMPVSNGSVIITNTAAGKWYLYGGTLTVFVAILASLATGRSRHNPLNVTFKGS